MSIIVDELHGSPFIRCTCIVVSRLVSEDTLGPGTVEPEASLEAAGLASAPLYAGLGRGRPPGAAGAAAVVVSVVGFAFVLVLLVPFTTPLEDPLTGPPGAGVGGASALKMSYSGIMKGVSGILVTMVLGASSCPCLYPHRAHVSRTQLRTPTRPRRPKRCSSSSPTRENRC